MSLVIETNEMKQDTKQEATANITEHAKLTLLSGRCATCDHWGGDREMVFDYATNANDINAFLDNDMTWAPDGKCRKLTTSQYLYDRDGCTAETDGVFGCIFHFPYTPILQVI